MWTLFFYAVTIPTAILYISIPYPLTLMSFLMSVPAWSLYGFDLPPQISILIKRLDSIPGLRSNWLSHYKGSLNHDL